MPNFKKILFGVLFFLIVVFVIVIFFGSRIINNKIKDANEMVNNTSEVVFDSVITTIPNLRGIDNSDIFIGLLESRVEIIVYEDLSDFYSVKLNESLISLKEAFPEDVVIAFRPYTDRSFPLSYPAYSLAKCAGDQGNFFGMRKLILEKVNNGELNEESFLSYAASLNLNQDEINKCLMDRKYFPEIEKLSKEAESFNVFGSPVVFVNKELIVGARSFNDVINGGGEKLLGLRNVVAKYLNIPMVDSASSEDEIVACAMDVFECPDGSFVSRDPANNCVFSSCPAIEPIVCTMDAKECPDGSFVGRDGNNDCEFFPCP
jgi:protein-disulfide isomerase